MGDLFSWPHLLLIAQIVIIFLVLPFWLYKSIRKIIFRLTEIEKAIKRIEKEFNTRNCQV